MGGQNEFRTQPEAQLSGRIAVEVGPRDSFAQDIESLGPLEAVDWHSTSEPPPGQRGSNPRLGYVISSIGPESKSSEDYALCLGVAVVGTDKKTGKNISLLTHHARASILDSGSDSDLLPLHEVLNDFYQVVDPKSISAVIFGGVAQRSHKSDDQEKNRKALAILAEAVKERLHVKQPQIIRRKESGSWSAILDTPNRKLFIVDEQESKRKVF